MSAEKPLRSGKRESLEVPGVTSLGGHQYRIQAIMLQVFF